MRRIPLINIFDIFYGSRKYTNKQGLEEGIIPLISSKDSNNGHYICCNIKPDYINQKIITIARTGSVGATFFHDYPCSVDDNCLVLKPKINLTNNQMLFYVSILKKERFKYMYGRQITPSRLANIEVPDYTDYSEWFNHTNNEDFNEIQAKKETRIVDLNSANWECFNYENVFNIKRGSENKKSNEIGFIPFISATEKNNGILGYINCELPEEENQLTVATVGSVCEAFWQENRFIASSNMLILNNKNLTKYSAMFINTLIRKEKYRYSYGRVWSMEKMRKSQIKLPVNDNGEPDWQFMEDYIKSLPFSSGL